MCIQQVQLYGPTNFSPIIYHVAKFGEVARNEPGPSVCTSCITHENHEMNKLNDMVVKFNLNKFD